MLDNNITFRLIQKEDAALIFEWRNTPFIASLGSQNRTVSWEEHLSWIENTVCSKTRKAFIILINDEPAGQVRFDKEEPDSDSCVISVYLIEKYTGKGRGVTAIQAGCELIKKEWPDIRSIQANVLKTNTNGQKAFLKAGFIYNPNVDDNKHYNYIKLMSNQNYIPDVWEKEIYGQGKHLNRYPFDSVVSFVYRNYPRDKERSEIKILEIGCGSGNNLWFAAREGFSVTGIDGSETVINYAKERFQNENLQGDFIVGDFTDLPFDNNEFDMVIDRGAIVCVNHDGAKKTFSEVARVLKPNGLFFLNLYSDRHSSYLSGTLLDDGFTTDIKDGTLTGVGNLCFYGKKEIDKLIGNSWFVQSFKHKTYEEMQGRIMIHAEWEIVLKKAI